MILVAAQVKYDAGNENFHINKKTVALEIIQIVLADCWLHSLSKMNLLAVCC